MSNKLFEWETSSNKKDNTGYVENKQNVSNAKIPWWPNFIQRLATFLTIVWGGICLLFGGILAIDVKDPTMIILTIIVIFAIGCGLIWGAAWVLGGGIGKRNVL